MILDPSTLVWVLVGCIAFFVVTLLIGDIADVSGSGGGLEAGAHDVDMGGDAHHGVTTSEIFTLRNFALLGVGFSGASLLAMRAGIGPLGTNAAGIVAGCVLVAFGIWLFRLIRGQESNSITSNTTLVEKTAIVTTSIPDGGFGEITLRDGQGTSVSLTAKSNAGLIKAGTEVKIVAVAGNLATVSASV